MWHGKRLRWNNYNIYTFIGKPTFTSVVLTSFRPWSCPKKLWKSKIRAVMNIIRFRERVESMNDRTNLLPETHTGLRPIDINFRLRNLWDWFHVRSNFVGWNAQCVCEHLPTTKTTFRPCPIRTLITCIYNCLHICYVNHVIHQ